MAGFLQVRLAALREAGTYRSLPGRREGIDFWSNDYLGFARIPTDTGPYPSIASGSRLISGDSEQVHGLEARIAAFHGYPTALLFGSGYTANVGLLSCLARRTDTIVYDALIHASLRDGIRLSHGRGRRWEHNSPEGAAAAIRDARSDGEVFVVTESRFSMDGDTAPLKALAEVCQELGAHLIVDEAHSIGIDGPYGAGLVAALGLQEQVFATVVTYGKAPGRSGAAVLGSPQLRDYLINTSRPFVFTTGPRPEQLAGIHSAYDLLQQQQEVVRQQLAAVTQHFSTSAFYTRIQGPGERCAGPIQIVYPRGKAAVMELEEAVREDGYLIKAIRSPTVASGEERLRICLHAFNTLEEVDGLVGSLRRHLEYQM